MLRKFKYLIVITLISTFMLTALFFFSDTKSTIEISDILSKVIYNNKELQKANHIFAVKDKIYIPLELLENAFNKKVEKDVSTGQITISDKPEPLVESLKAEITQKDSKLSELEQKVKSLEAENQNKVMRLDAIEQMINTESSTLMNIPFTVLLSGNSSDVKVKIEIDLKQYSQEWNAFKANDKISFIQGVCDIITSTYTDAKIKGYVKDISRSRKALSFYNTYDGKIKIGTYKDMNTVSILEDDLGDKYSSVFSGIDMTIKLNGNENQITYSLNVHGFLYNDKWVKLSDSIIKNTMKRVSSDIQLKFKDAVIYGCIYDLDNDKSLADAVTQPDAMSFFRNE